MSTEAIAVICILFAILPYTEGIISRHLERRRRLMKLDRDTKLFNDIISYGRLQQQKQPKR